MAGYSSNLNEGYNEAPGVNWGRIAGYAAGGVMALGLMRMGVARTLGTARAQRGMSRIRGIAGDFKKGVSGGQRAKPTANVTDIYPRARAQGPAPANTNMGINRKNSLAKNNTRAVSADAPGGIEGAGYHFSNNVSPNLSQEMAQHMPPRPPVRRRHQTRATHFLEAPQVPNARPPVSGPFEGFANAREGAHYASPFSSGYVPQGGGGGALPRGMKSPFQSENMGGVGGGSTKLSPGPVSPLGSSAKKAGGKNSGGGKRRR